jgi:diadenylate cyclase
MTENILQDILNFFSDLFENLRNGVLFFGNPLDILLALIDILITTLAVYFVLKLIRDTRAWQLLKGIILIIVFSQIFSIIGLQTIGFILTNTLSVLAIAFVVIFQPELRRALEAVGRNSLTLLSGVVNQDMQTNRNNVYAMIDSIVRASEKLIETGTGALIIIERETKLGEFTEQDNAVVLDSSVSATLLLQIFYKGSPLHDGAVLIRDGRIMAARCHVPLSDNYQLRKDYGTRHRAAIGVSEMGDALAIVVSEEKAVVSIAIDGRLITLDNVDALRTILHRQLDPERQGGVISQIIKTTKKNRKNSLNNRNTGMPDAPIITIKMNDTTNSDSSREGSPKGEEKSQETHKKHRLNFIRRRKFLLFSNRSPSKYTGKDRLIMITTSLFVAIFIWLYVQITINPVEIRSFTVPLSVIGMEEIRENGLNVTYTTSSISINLKGRKKNLDRLVPSDITASINLSDIESPEAVYIPVSVRVRGLSYYETENINPGTIFTQITPEN